MMVDRLLFDWPGTEFVRQLKSHRKTWMLLLLVAPLVSGCGSASDMFSSDLLSKDADWFSRSGRLFIKNVSMTFFAFPVVVPSGEIVSVEVVVSGLKPASCVSIVGS